MLCQSYILESEVEGNQHNQIIRSHISTELISVQNAYNTIVARATSLGQNKIIFYFLKIVGRLFRLFGNRNEVIYVFCLQTSEQRRLSAEH